MKYQVGDVSFDDFDGPRSVLKDAKGDYSFMLKENGDWQAWFNRQKWVKLADRQLAAARGCAVEWDFAFKDQADAVRQLVAGRINVVYVPPNF